MAEDAIFLQKNHPLGQDIPRVSIIILNWNGWKDTVECLESLYRITYPNYDVIVVDNGSEDDSIQKIKEYAEGKIRVDSKFFEYNPSNKPIEVFEVTEDDAKEGEFNRLIYEKHDVNRRLILLKNKDNYGFAGGNNVAIKFALSILNPDYVLLLNNDTVVDPKFLSELVEVAESDEKIGIVGPKIYYYNYNGRTDVINFAGADFIIWKAKEIRYGDREIDKGQYSKENSVGKLDGSCMMIDKTILSDVGLFFPEFFAYWEETDLCCRVKKSGYKLVYAPKAKIWHKKPISGKGEKPLYVYYMTRNKFLFIKRNASQVDKLKFLLYFFWFDIWLSLGIYFHKGKLKILQPFLKGIMDGIKTFI